ncbi:SH3-domain-containing protein [Agrocybe pediades]|nr:SH3-domain-containing protein [Agrocybe pediades]
MVFSSLQPHEKEAFFSLLDEYFASRPEIFANLAGAQQSDAGSAPTTAQGAAVSMVGRAMANNPEATAKFMSAGLKQVANARSAGGGGGPNQNAGPQGVTSVAGRVAAAQAALASSRNSYSAASSPPPIAEKPAASGLFGNTVDTTSATGFLGSLRNSSKPVSPPQVNVPPAFPARQNSFAPPPRRTASSSSSVNHPPETASPPAPPPPAPRWQPPPQPQQPEPEEEEEQGEWVEALYEYDSGEAGDLKITEGQRILLLERTSDDWWTGEVNGKKGLFPASYVKAL